MNLKKLRPERILVIKLKHIGDLLVAVPALRAVKEKWPTARLDVVINHGMGALVKGLDFIDELIELDRGRAKRSLRAEWGFAQELRRRNYDLVIDFTGGERSAWYALLSRAKVCIGADDPKGFPGRRRIFNAVVPWGAGHYVDNHLAILAPLGIEATDKKMEVAIPPAAYDTAEEKNRFFQSEYIIVHPTSRWMFKSWPAAQCIATIELLRQLGHTVVLTSGPAEKERYHVKKIMSELANPEKVLNLSGRTTLPELAALIKETALFLGVDSAPLHIASAVGTPAVALFGPSGAFNWGPWQIPNRVLYADRACSPCGRDGCDGSKQSECLAEIGPEQVVAAVAELLARR